LITIILTLGDADVLNNILYNISNDLSKHKRDKESMYRECVAERLDKSLNSYISELKDSYGYLSRRTEIRVLSKINRG
jgi:hypothetical protein